MVLFVLSDSDAHSTTSSMSPSQSPSYESDDGSDIESKQRRPTPSVFSFLDRSYWKRYVNEVYEIEVCLENLNFI